MDLDVYRGNVHVLLPTLRERSEKISVVVTAMNLPIEVVPGDI